MFISYKLDYIDNAFRLCIVDTEFVEMTADYPHEYLSNNGGISAQPFVGMVKCYQRRGLDVAANVVLWYQWLPCKLNANELAAQYSIIEPYKQDIEKYLTLL